MSKEIIEKKLIMAAKIIESEEYKRADELMKKVNKLKEDVKAYCQKKSISELSAEDEEKVYSVEYKIRSQKKPDTSLLAPEIIDSIIIDIEVWLQYFSIKEKK